MREQACRPSCRLRQLRRHLPPHPLHGAAAHADELCRLEDTVPGAAGAVQEHERRPGWIGTWDEVVNVGLLCHGDVGVIGERRFDLIPYR